MSKTLALNNPAILYTREMGIPFDGKFTLMDGLWFFVSLDGEDYRRNEKLVKGQTPWKTKRPILLEDGDELNLNGKVLKIIQQNVST